MAALAASYVREAPAPPTSRMTLCCPTGEDLRKNFDVTASAADLCRALCLLDTNDDGKLAAEDVDALFELALGVDAKNCSGTWRAVKAAAMCGEGQLDVRFLLKLAGTAVFNKAVSQMLPLPLEPRLFPFTSVVEYVQVFREFDRDRNGLICARDLHEVIRDGSVDLPLEHCEVIIRAVGPETSAEGLGLLCFGKLIQRLTTLELSSAVLLPVL